MLIASFFWSRREINQRRRAAAELHLANDALSSEISERQSAEASLRKLNEALRLATEQAQAADRVKSAFLATMSHELRTPLNSIIGFTGILLQGLAGLLNAEQTKQMGMVQGSSRHLLALINDVLDISKIEAGQLEIGRASFDLRALIEKVAGIARPLAEKKGLPLQVTLGPGVGTMLADARRVEQVLLNLLSNAIKFTERGSVVLAAEPRRIAPSRRSHPRDRQRHGHQTRRPGHPVPAVSPDRLGTAAQPRGRWPWAHHLPPPGRADGRHDHRAEPLAAGQRLCFHPAVDRGEQDMKPTILLIEDNEPNRYLATFLLEAGGYAVARALKSDPRHAAIPIVAVTSYAMVNDREAALAAGCNGYIEKLIDPQSFVSTMEQYLRPGAGESAP